MDNIKEQLSNNSLLGILRLCISIPFLSTKTCFLIFFVSILCPPLLFCAFVAFTSLFGTLYHQILNKEIVITFLLPIIHQIVFLVFTLVPSTIAMFLTIASVYTSEPIPFFSFFRAIFYIFLQYFDTFFLVMAFVSLYRALLINTICLSILAYHTNNPLLFLVACIVLFLFIALQFFTEHWLIACFVSMFEGIHGMAALKRSRELIKGRADKLGILLFFLVCEWIQLQQEISMLGDKLNSGSTDWRIKLSAVPTFGLLFPVILFGVSAQTVLYFISNQQIDKDALSKRLGYPRNPQTVADLQLLELPYLQRGNQSFSVHVVANVPTPLPICLPLQYSLVDMSFILLCTSMLLVLFLLSSFRVYLD